MNQETKEQSASQEETRPGVTLVTPSQGDVVAAPPTNGTTSCPTCASGAGSMPISHRDRPDRGTLPSPLGREGIRSGGRTCRDRGTNRSGGVLQGAFQTRQPLSRPPAVLGVNDPG